MKTYPCDAIDCFGRSHCPFKWNEDDDAEIVDCYMMCGLGADEDEPGMEYYAEYEEENW